MSLINNIKTRLEKSAEKRRLQNIKHEEPVKVILGPEGPICPID